MVYHILPDWNNKSHIYFPGVCSDQIYKRHSLTHSQARFTLKVYTYFEIKYTSFGVVTIIYKADTDTFLQQQITYCTYGHKFTYIHDNNYYFVCVA